MRTISLLSITAIYAVCFIVIEAGLAYAPPLQFAGLRALIAGAALLVVAGVRGQPLFPRRDVWLSVLALSLTAPTATFAGMFLSSTQTEAGMASVLANMQPLFTILLAALFLGESLTPSKVAGVALGFVGVMLILGPNTVSNNTSTWGILIALTVSVSAAASNVIFKAIGPQRDLLTLTAWQFMVGSVFLLISSALVEQQTSIRWNVEFVWLLLFLALAGTSFTTVTWYWLIQSENVGRLSLALFLVPVLGLAVAVVFLGETITLLQATGVGIVLVGVGLTPGRRNG